MEESVHSIDKKREENMEKAKQNDSGEDPAEWMDPPCYELRSNDKVGRHLVISRDMDAGQIILSTLPLATGPLSPNQDPPGPAPCLVCYKPLDGENSIFICSGCGWPLCSEKCSFHPRHLPECVATAATGTKVSFKDPTSWDSLYDCIIILRCLSLRISSTISWKQIEFMESHEGTKRPATRHRRSKALAALFQARFGNSYGATISDILRIIDILEVNAMEVTSAGTSLQAIYPIACLAEHSCVPTAFRVFGSSDEGFPLVLRTAVSITSGTPISLTYTDSLWGTPERRTHLYYSKLFLCNCDRCTDREEMGACLTALRCNKCGDCVLPDDPLSEGWLKGARAEAAEKWSCRSCKQDYDGGKARRAVWQITDLIKELEDNDEAEVNDYEEVLGSLLVKLHPRHATVIDLKHSILHLLNPTQVLQDQQLNRKEQLAREVLEVANILFPGISQLKGTCLFELASTIMEKLMRTDELKNLELKAIEEVEKKFEECIYHLHYQPKCQPEHQLLTEAMAKLEEISQMKKELENKD